MTQPHSPLRWSVCGPGGRFHSPGPRTIACQSDLSPLAPRPTEPAHSDTQWHTVTHSDTHTHNTTGCSPQLSIMSAEPHLHLQWHLLLLPHFPLPLVWHANWLKWVMFHILIDWPSFGCVTWHLTPVTWHLSPSRQIKKWVSPTETYMGMSVHLAAVRHAWNECEETHEERGALLLLLLLLLLLQATHQPSMNHWF